MRYFLPYLPEGVDATLGLSQLARYFPSWVVYTRVTLMAEIASITQEASVGLFVTSKKKKRALKLPVNLWQQVRLFQKQDSSG